MFIYQAVKLFIILIVYLLSDQASRGLSYASVRGLGGVPDVPHAVNVSEKTEGNGVGVTKEPPVNATGLVASELPGIGTSSLCFRVRLTECLEVSWETLLAGRKLIVEIRSGILPEGYKERSAAWGNLI